MNHIKKAFFCVAVLLGAFSTQVFADSTIKPAEFVDEASSKGLAEIESAKLALNESNSQAIRSFAETMIADHTKANQELAAIAQSKNLEVADEPELMSKTKAMILKLREGESFDEAYANNQVMLTNKPLIYFNEALTQKMPKSKTLRKKLYRN